MHATREPDQTLLERVIPRVAFDPAILRLPHPVRVPRVEALAGLDQDADTILATLIRGYRLPPANASRVLEMIRDPGIAPFELSASMAKIMGPLRVDPSTTNLGELDGAIVTWRNRLMPVPIFQTRDSLEESLASTALGARLEARFFRLPMPRLYIECGETRSSPLVIHNDASGTHVLEGAYLDEHRRLNPATGETVRVISVMLTGSPIGKRNPLDDAYYTMILNVLDESMSIADLLQNTFTNGCRSERFPAWARLRRFDAHHEAAMLAAIEHLAKILLYLNCSNARTQLSPEYSELQREASRIRSSSKRAKAERRASRTYDRILVGAPAGPRPGAGSEETGRRLATHLRRGHFHTVRFGPGKQDSKLDFYESVVVNPAGLDVPAPRNYSVG